MGIDPWVASFGIAVAAMLVIWTFVMFALEYGIFYCLMFLIIFLGVFYTLMYLAHEAIT